jgi:hypothetical protein
MNKFYLNPKLVYQILKEKGVSNLYHANTVLTSLTFIREKALLSRKYVEENNLIQTEQKSDELDKLYNVWDSVFLDGLDLHKKYSRANFYGPILFVMKLELLLSPSISNLVITKNNPMYWKGIADLDPCYYDDLEQFKNDYLTGKNLDSRVMFTFRSPDKNFKLNKFLKEIILDKPKAFVNFKKGPKNVGEVIYERIRKALDENALTFIPIKFRHEDDVYSYCGCNIKYTYLCNVKVNEFNKLFRSKPY